MSETNHEIKLVLTDLDGTVAQLGKHIVSDAVRQSVIACEERGTRMVPVTGRYLGMAKDLLEVLGFEDLGIFDNGATIQQIKSGEVIWSRWLEPETVRQVAKILTPVSTIIDYTPDHVEHEPADNELERIEKLVETPVSHVYGLVEVDKLPAIQEQLSKIPSIGFYSAVSLRSEWPHHLGIQVNHVEADKFHGVTALRQIINVPKEHTLAIGDGHNDLPLFENAGLKIAMGNASDGLKAAADYTVGTVDEDGFAEAMRRFVL